MHFHTGTLLNRLNGLAKTCKVQDYYGKEWECMDVCDVDYDYYAYCQYGEEYVCKLTDPNAVNTYNIDWNIGLRNEEMKKQVKSGKTKNEE